MTPIVAEVPITAPMPERNVPKEAGVLTPGQRLRIRSDSTESLLSPADSAQVARLHLPAHRRHGRGGRHGHQLASRRITVQPGETLASIANRHGVSVPQLKRANGLSTSRIYKGQRLKLKEG